MAETEVSMPVGEVLRQFASVYDGLDEANALVNEAQVESLRVTERDVLLALVRGAQARLQSLESRLAPAQLDDIPPALDAPSIVSGPEVVDTASEVIAFTPPEPPESHVNGHESVEALTELTVVPDPAELAPAVVSEPTTDSLGLPAVEGIPAPDAAVVEDKADAVSEDVTGAVPAEGSDVEATQDDAKQSSAEVLTERQTSLVRLSPEKLAQREEENTAALGGNHPVVEFTIVDDLSIRTSIREIRFRLSKNGEPNLMLTVVNTLLDQLIEQQRTELTGVELSRLTGFETNQIADNHNTWKNRFNVAPFLTRGFGGNRVYYLNPLYSFGDERQNGGDDPEPILPEPAEARVAAGDPDVKDGETEDAAATLPGPETGAAVSDVPADQTAPAPADEESLAENGSVRLTDWGLEWTTKGGHSLVLLNGKAMIPMRPLIADVLAFTAQSGGSVVYTDLLEALERKYSDLQPSDLLSALGQIEALFARHAAADRFTNEIVSKAGAPPARIVTLAGVVAQPEGRDFLAAQTQMAS